MPQDIVKWAMCKLRVDEWLIDVVMSMYANATSSVRINGTLGEKFGVPGWCTSGICIESFVVHHGP